MENKFESEYLIKGWKDDEVKLNNIEINNESISCNFYFINFYIPKSNKFHLAIPTVFNIVGQLAIVYACNDNDLSEKTDEVYLSEINLKCRTEITKTKDLYIKLTLINKKKINNRIFYKGSIDIEDGAMTGVGSFIFPINID